MFTVFFQVEEGDDDKDIGDDSAGECDMPTGHIAPGIIGGSTIYTPSSGGGSNSLSGMMMEHGHQLSNGAANVTDQQQQHRGGNVGGHVISGAMGIVGQQQQQQRAPVDHPQRRDKRDN
jgi:hypothetical protein